MSTSNFVYLFEMYQAPLKRPLAKKVNTFIDAVVQLMLTFVLAFGWHFVLFAVVKVGNRLRNSLGAAEQRDKSKPDESVKGKVAAVLDPVFSVIVCFYWLYSIASVSLVAFSSAVFVCVAVTSVHIFFELSIERRCELLNAIQTKIRNMYIVQR